MKTRGRTYRMLSSLSHQYGQFVSRAAAEGMWHASCLGPLRPFGNIAGTEKRQRPDTQGLRPAIELEVSDADYRRYMIESFQKRSRRCSSLFIWVNSSEPMPPTFWIEPM